MVDHILLDMDGVLSDFQRAAMGMFGYTRSTTSHHPGGVMFSHEDDTAGQGYGDRLYPYGEWDIPSVLGISANTFWNKLHLNENFFAKLPVLEGARELLDFIRNSGIPFTICTSPSLDAEDATAKVRWMRTLLEDSNFMDYMVGPQKWLMANPCHLLIDDSPVNCEAFRKPRGSSPGGQAFLWPQYWNEAHSAREDRLHDVKRLILPT